MQVQQASCPVVRLRRAGYRACGMVVAPRLAAAQALQLRVVAAGSQQPIALKASLLSRILLLQHSPHAPHHLQAALPRQLGRQLRVGQRLAQHIVQRAAAAVLCSLRGEGGRGCSGAG